LLEALLALTDFSSFTGLYFSLAELVLLSLLVSFLGDGVSSFLTGVFDLEGFFSGVSYGVFFFLGAITY